MRQRSNRSIGCSKEGRWLRGGSNGGKLWKSISSASPEISGSSLTQWLLLQDQEHGVNQFEVLGEVVQLFQVSPLQENILTISVYVRSKG